VPDFEGDIFKTIIPIKSDANGLVDLRTGPTQDEQANEHVNRKVDIIYALKDNPKLTLKQIAVKANISYATARREMDALREKGAVKRIGSDKAGCWEVIEIGKRTE